jgi:ketosteroid isomerase-like protein
MGASLELWRGGLRVQEALALSGDDLAAARREPPALSRSEQAGPAGLQPSGLHTSSMASENVNLVRSIFMAWERGDFSSAEWAHPEIEYVIVGGPSPGNWTGLAGMAGAVRDLLGAWEGHRTAAEEYRELDDEQVLVLACYSGRGRASGLEIGQLRHPGAALFQVQCGMVTRHVIYFDRNLAFADLGLAPEAGGTD